VWNGALLWCNNQFFVAKVRSEVFAHLHAVAVKRHSSMRNGLFDLPGRSLCEQFPWCKKKWWACSWLCSSSVSPFSVSVSLDSPCTAHAFFPYSSSNHCQGLCRTFPGICTTVVAAPSSDPSRNRIRPDILLQIKGLKDQDIHTAAWYSGTLTPKICYYCNLLLIRDITTAVKMAAPVPEVKDIAVYYLPLRSNETLSKCRCWVMTVLQHQRCFILSPIQCCITRANGTGKLSLE
jgi:hypothetical protein